MVIRIRVGEVSPEYKKLQGRWRFVDSVLEVPYDYLYSIGVRRILLDYDGTLVKSYRSVPEGEVLDLLKKLTKRFEVLVFSNGWFLRSRRRLFLEKLGIPYVITRKPFVFEYTRLSEPKMTVLVGDKITTDGLYSLVRGIPCYLIRKKWFFWR